MIRKEIAIRTIRDLPDSATWADIEECIRFLVGIDKGLADIKADRVVPHEQVKASLARPHSNSRHNLRELVRRIPVGYRPKELDWADPMGCEVW